jgi:tetratricopeptide (TPR) repeat protein
VGLIEAIVTNAPEPFSRRELAPKTETCNTLIMPTAQEQYDDAMFDFSTGEYDLAIAKLQAILAEDAADFDAQLSLGMAYYRKGDFARAIEEGHKAEKLRPKEQLVHTNLSLFYMKSGNKQTAEHHGLQARIAGWRDNMAPPTAANVSDPELQIGKPPPPPLKVPDMPWKKKPPVAPSAPPAEDKKHE